MTPQQALAWLNGGWKSSPYARVIAAAGGLGLDFDKVFGFQCKDLANAYGAALGTPVPSGNAIVLATELPKGWKYVSEPQAGDLAIRHYVAGDIDYGDVVAVLAVSGSNVHTIGQNQQDVSLEVGHVPTVQYYPKADFFKFLRPAYSSTAQFAIWGPNTSYASITKSFGTPATTIESWNAAIPLPELGSTIKVTPTKTAQWGPNTSYAAILKSFKTPYTTLAKLNPKLVKIGTKFRVK